jgi:hypothetical protein
MTLKSQTKSKTTLSLTVFLRYKEAGKFPPLLFIQLLRIPITTITTIHTLVLSNHATLWHHHRPILRQRRRGL